MFASRYGGQWLPGQRLSLRDDSKGLRCSSAILQQVRLLLNFALAWVFDPGPVELVFRCDGFLR